MGDIDRPDSAARLASVNVSVDGTLLTSWLSVDVGTVVGRHDRAGMVVFDTLPVNGFSHPIADVLPDGRLLVVTARVPPDRSSNAVVLDRAGEVAQSGLLGYGIAHLSVDRSGGIWCGYFDEGVFGNLGWPAPSPQAGLVRFDDRLVPTWELAPPPEFNTMADCYALNVEHDVWACYYTDFPIVRVRDGHQTFWPNDSTTGPRAIVVDEPVVALVGGYGDDRDRVVLGRVDADCFQEDARLRLVDPSGQQLHGFKLFGRGADLHVVTRRARYHVSLADLQAAGR